MSFSHTMPAMLLLAVATAAAGAQPTLDLSPSCSTCRLRFEEVVAFQADWGSGGLPTRPMAVHRFARSHWIVLDAEAATVYRFDERGRYVGLIARRGAGPTEMQSPTLLLDWGADSVAVFDSGNAKALIFGPSGRLEREERVDVVPTIRASRLASGGFLVAGMIGTHAGFGMPFHEYSRQGALVRSFGSPADARVVRPSQVPTYRTPMRIAASGTFWAVDARSPVIRQFALGNTQRSEWQLPMSGFENFTTRRPGGAHGAEFFTIEERSDGLLMVGMILPDPRSLEAVGEARIVDGHRVTVVDDWGRYVNTRFFVLDPANRRLIATADEDAYVSGSLGDGMYWGIRPGGDGGRLVVLRATFTR